MHAQRLTHMYIHTWIHTWCIYTRAYTQEHTLAIYVHTHMHSCSQALLFVLLSTSWKPKVPEMCLALSLVWQWSVTGYLQLSSCPKSSKPRSHQNCSRRSTPVLITFFLLHMASPSSTTAVSWGYTKNRVCALGFMASNSCSWTLEHLCAMLVYLSIIKITETTIQKEE